MTAEKKLKRIEIKSKKKIFKADGLENQSKKVFLSNQSLKFNLKKQKKMIEIKSGIDQGLDYVVYNIRKLTKKYIFEVFIYLLNSI